MKLLTIDTADGGHPGVVVGDNQVLDLATAPESVMAGWRPASVREILERVAMTDWTRSAALPVPPKARWKNARSV